MAGTTVLAKIQNHAAGGRDALPPRFLILATAKAFPALLWVVLNSFARAFLILLGGS